MKKIAISNRMKPRRRLTSEKQILAKIDLCHVRSRQKRTEAEAIDRQADEVFRLAGKERNDGERLKLVEHATFLRKDADELRVSATRLIEVRAKKLGDRLSEFRTELLPCDGVGDTSVPML